MIQSYSKNSTPVFPIGLARIIAPIKDQHEIMVFDPQLKQRFENNLEQTLKHFQPQIIGVSLRNIDSIDYIGRQYFYPDFVKMVSRIKAILPKSIVVAGGSGFSLFAEAIMKDCPQIDFGAFQEGDTSFPELLENLDHPDEVKGIFVRTGNGVQFTGNRKPVDINSLPRPAYEYFELDRYLSRISGIGIEAKRGCSLKCSYCPYPFLNGSSLRIRSVEAIVDEMEYLVSKYRVDHFTFVDSVFNIPLEHSVEICNEILKRKLNIKWSAWCNEKTFSEDYARLALRAGCVGFPFASDAFTDTSLQRLQKNYTQKDILNTVEIANRVDGIRIGYSFFLNPPGASVKTLFQVIRFLMQTKKKLGEKMGKTMGFNLIRIEPHTRMHEIALREGIVTADNNLLKPVYYSQRSTYPIEVLYKAFASLLTMALKLRRFIKNRKTDKTKH